MKASFTKHSLLFKQASGTSRGVLTEKETFLLEISQGDKKGIGECALFRGLSYDDVPEYEQKLQWLCQNIHEPEEFLLTELKSFPSIVFGLEQALKNLKHGGHLYFPSAFTEGKSSIKINGLIWMGSADFMQKQIEEKLSQGFDCIKLKIGVDWPSEKEIITQLRKNFPKEQLEIRVDANGAFDFETAKRVLMELSALGIHSIEQPIKKSSIKGNYEEMAALCSQTPTPIALDEELIGIVEYQDKKNLLETIFPQYIILKPALVGGFSGTDEWISLAETMGIPWWITSALESNIGLNAICQYTFTKNNPLPQGLGTGALFTNNFESPLVLKGDQMWYL